MLGVVDEKRQELEEDIQSLKLKVSMLEAEKYKKMNTLNKKALEGDQLTTEEKDMLKKEVDLVETLRNELQKEPIKESRSRRLEQKRVDRHSLSLTFRRKKGVISFTSMTTKTAGESVSIGEANSGKSGAQEIKEILQKAKEENLSKEDLIDKVSACINRIYQEFRPFQLTALKSVDEDVIVQQKSNTRFSVYNQVLPHFDEVTVDEEVNRLGEKMVLGYDDLVMRVCDSVAVVASVLVDTVSFASLAVARPEIEQYITQFQTAIEALKVKIIGLMTIVKELIETYVKCCECVDDDFKKYLENYNFGVSVLQKIDLEPVVNSFIVEAAKGEGQQLRVGFIEKDFYESGESLSSVVSRLIMVIGNVVRNRISKMEDVTKKKKKDKADEDNPFVLPSKDIVKLEFNEVTSVCYSFLESLKVYVGKVYTAREVRNISENSTTRLKEEPCDFWQEIRSKEAPKTNGDPPETKLAAGSLNRIIETLTSPLFNDTLYRRAFMFSFPVFTTAKKVIDTLFTRFMVPLGDKPSDEEKKTAMVIKSRVIVALKYFCDDALDECNQSLLEYMKDFLNRPEHGESYQKSLKSLTQTIDKRLYERNQMISNYFIPPVDLFFTQDMCSPTLFFTRMDDYEIAKQLTMVDSAIYRAVRSTELIGLSFDKMKHRAPNVCKMLSRLDAISHWIGTTILMFYDVDMRAKILNKFVSIADKLYQLQNFQSLAAFYFGFEYPPVSRLGATTALLTPQSTKIIKTISALFCPDNQNYKLYRNLLIEAKGATVPFVAVITKDLTFNLEGNEKFVDSPQGKLIKMEVQERSMKYIDEFLSFQQFNYNFPVVQPIYNYLKNVICQPEDLLYKTSVTVEPRKSK
ncbi:ras guanine nucleotide exchange factor, slime mold, putative [Entamoeba invadens IP1]|uniref:Ras guanine nucleotide exchange factor, slime mold, putative n=1 Tax=Entamoeba invadens IP1 TaxID=370355 RepID=A0A0A1TX88_ENTIV|nr:ras guanine nucleotide exchange factor, slime mold, putative [Entamoeba invadens IP1]ELP85925.1 ras guanine nucleotide exchange factor, slime mold, putative [Entamoeba invadens IP1]|eukprot:XP_004185271.1 ras guanine nucleotide exchange factor, slime mold, putative [Entamoeba invadens IP1]